MKRIWVLLVVVLAAAVALAAKTSSSEAIARLLNSRASGSPRGYAQAAELVLVDAEKGRPLQQFVLALVSQESDAPKAARMSAEQRERYLNGSREKIRTLAETKGNALAWYLLSLENNDLSMLKRAAEGKNVQALNAYGTITLTKALSDPMMASNEVDRVLRKSFGYFQEAAKENDPNGLYNLGMCYLRGYGVDADIDRAFESFRIAAEAGHPEAINNLGGFFRDGVVVERDVVTATKWFAKSAAMDNAFGQLNYALALQRGEGLPVDKVQAVELFRKSANHGCAEAMDALGTALFNGDGCEADQVEAVKWYLAAARRGFAPAMDNLSFCYDTGKGVPAQDPTQATIWKIRAKAARGDRNAAVWLSQNGHSLR